MSTSPAIAEIKEKTDLVALISEYMPLTRAGVNFKGLCPFHAEKSPSFMVSPDKGSWHCFGCNEGGDALSFLMKIDGSTFPEALEKLAQRAGIVLPTHNIMQRGDREAYLNELFMTRAEQLLQSNEGAKARLYLNERQVPIEVQEQFHLGYVSEDNIGWVKWFGLKNIGVDQLVKAGLATKTQKGVWMRFRGRLLFPFVETNGRVIGFTARALSAKDPLPKYINSPQTDLYKKNSFLYGLHAARTSIRRKDYSVVVEGQMDLLASVKAGVPNAIAVSGTALTEQHLDRLKKLSNNIIYAFDSDGAGSDAARRSIHLAEEMGMSVRLAILPAGKDPDELVKKSPFMWQQAVATSVRAMDFLFEYARKKYPITTIEGKRDFARMMVSEIARIQDVVEQTHYLQMLAKELHVDETLLRTALDKAMTKLAEIRAKQRDEAQVREKNAHSLQQGRNQSRDTFNASGPNKRGSRFLQKAQREQPIDTSVTGKHTLLLAERDQLWQRLAMLLIDDPTLASHIDREAEMLAPSKSEFRDLYKWINDQYSNDHRLTGEGLYTKMREEHPEWLPLADALSLKWGYERDRVPGISAVGEITTAWKRLRLLTIDDQLRHLARALHDAQEQQSPIDDLRRLERTSFDLQQEKRSLQRTSP